MLGDWIIETQEFLKNLWIATKNTARENTCLHDYKLVEPKISGEAKYKINGGMYMVPVWYTKEEYHCKKCGRVK
ncbi:hypothetical protein [Tetragenococcus koreensis]|uniref:hypothetical protein n=1 Tax=Tetragenococcus koreensis TaxID=290335 RepID=UPI000F4D83C7|nr:hypothetical protein [Tetragenococcus koreensis]AYW46766.1 hypothetical protein C7K43_13060 [Tetragenococcus koreensis]GEN89985.1 hypothetical protein TKO01_00310 [Tetragenococcus koreensis]